MSCGVGCKHGLDLVLLWLWCRSAAATLIRPLAWELPYVMGVALHIYMCVCVCMYTYDFPEKYNPPEEKQYSTCYA